MKKYSKKIALILVLALALVTAIPALATSTVIDGEYDPIPLSVIVPGNVDAILNPFGLPVKIMADDGATNIGSLTNPGQIATKPLVGVNMSEVDLYVGATVTGTPRGNFKFATSAPSKTATTNTGLVYLQVKASSADLAYSTTVDTTTVCGGFDGTAVLGELNGWALPAKYSASDADKLIISTRESTKSEMCQIKKGIASVSGGDVDTPDAKGYFVARVTGNIVQKPKTAWVTGDGFTANITWEFTPVPANP